jgi:succinate dehydrogenase / fumarate reductase cytochrome b subunit
MASFVIPRAFIWRRVHSLMGLWLVVFLSEHLLTNSQAALWLGDQGQGFVRMVNSLHNLPYLEVIEVTLLGIPLLIHMVWGIRYALTGKMNSFKTDGSKPFIKERRNSAYSWQRITSWILLVLLIGHIVKFRFIEYPHAVELHYKTYYAVEISPDEKLPRLAERLRVHVLDGKSEEGDARLFQEKLPMQKLSSHQVMAVAPDFGTATLLTVRDTFKNPFYVALYTLFVVVACFHAFNGFWTFLITWGWILKAAAQRAWTTVAVCLMALFIFLGLAAIWGSYFVGS